MTADTDMIIGETRDEGSLRGVQHLVARAIETAEIPTAAGATEADHRWHFLRFLAQYLTRLSNDVVAFRDGLGELCYQKTSSGR